MKFPYRQRSVALPSRAHRRRTPRQTHSRLSRVQYLHTKEIRPATARLNLQIPPTQRLTRPEAGWILARRSRHEAISVHSTQAEFYTLDTHGRQQVFWADARPRRSNLQHSPGQGFPVDTSNTTTPRVEQHTVHDSRHRQKKTPFRRHPRRHRHASATSSPPLHTDTSPVASSVKLVFQPSRK